MFSFSPNILLHEDQHCRIMFVPLTLKLFPNFPGLIDQPILVHGFGCIRMLHKCSSEFKSGEFSDDSIHTKLNLSFIFLNDRFDMGCPSSMHGNYITLNRGHIALVQIIRINQHNYVSLFISIDSRIPFNNTKFIFSFIWNTSSNNNFSKRILAVIIAGLYEDRL